MFLVVNIAFNKMATLAGEVADVLFFTKQYQEKEKCESTGILGKEAGHEMVLVHHEYNCSIHVVIPFSSKCSFMSPLFINVKILKQRS